MRPSNPSDAHDDWVDSPEGRLHIDQWRAALLAQQQFLSGPHQSDAALEVEIPDVVTA